MNNNDHDDTGRNGNMSPADLAILIQKEHEIIDRMEVKFKIGDRVTSIKTGLPGVGRVIAVLTGRFFAGAFSNHNFKRWNNLYPNWTEEPVYHILFDEPRYILSKEEFDEGKRDGLLPDYLPYEATTKHSIISFPQADLELF